MKNFENIINECVETEMNEGCHEDYIKDYSSKLEFYLSNVTGNQDQSYRDMLQEAYDLTEEESQEIQDEIINKIKSKCEE